ncbi:MAG: PHP domain-containing protein [Candidatus Krumholzibacteriia bacterium]
MYSDTDHDQVPICPSPATRQRLGGLKQEGNGLVRPCDVRGILHCHTLYGDGAHTLRAMVDTAREIGLEYLGVSDHARSPAHPEGLDEDALARQRDEIDAINEEQPDFSVLQGVEVDMGEDGSLPLPEETLADCEYMIVSLEDGNGGNVATRTAHAIRAIMHPLTTILSRPVSEYMFGGPPSPIDLEAILQAARECGTAVEVSAIPERMDQAAAYCRRAQELGVLLSINPNAHRAARLVDYRHGVELTRLAGLCCRQILNTFTGEELRAFLARGAA